MPFHSVKSKREKGKFDVENADTGEVKNAEPYDSEAEAEKYSGALNAHSEDTSKAAKTGELHKFAPMVKMEKRADGTSLIWFRVSSETPDSDNEICDYEHSKPNFLKHSEHVFKISKGKSKFNVREQHGETAAGRALEFLARDKEKDFLAGVEIVDAGTTEKFEKGVLNGASIGGRYGPWSKQDGPYRRYEADPKEFSLVDIPSNGDALPIDMPAEFEFVRADGAIELRKFVTVKGEPMTEPITPEVPALVEDPKPVTFDDLLANADAATLQTYLEKLQKTIKPEELQKTDAPAPAADDKGGQAAQEPAPADDGKATVPPVDQLRAAILGILEELGLVVKEGETMKAVQATDLQKSAEALDLVKADFVKQQGELSKAISDGDKALAGDIAKLITEGEELAKSVAAVTGMGPVIMIPGGAAAAEMAKSQEVETLKKYQASARTPAEAARFGELIAAAEIKSIQNPKKE
jgi:hypothetical protein